MTGRQLLLAAVRSLGFAWLALPVSSTAIRLVAGGLLAALVAPWVGEAAQGFLGAELMREALAGLTLGLVASLPWRAAMGAGALLDHWRRPGREDGVMTQAWLLLGLGLFASVDGPRVWVEGLARSYLALPAGRLPGSGGLGALVDAGGALVGAAISAAAPILVAALGAEVIVEMAKRSAPSLRLGGARRLREPLLLLVLALTAGAALLALRDGLASAGPSLLDVARAMGG